MSLLSRHLEQISLSADAIVSLPFPPPKIFTNALLSTPDITSLIRDTEPHERALFSVPPPPPPSNSSNPFGDSSSTINNKNRRQTVFNVAGGEVSTNTGAGGGSRVPRRNTAVAAVLGQELHSEVRRTEGKGEIDIEVLLRGVEKLNAVYEVRGVHERIHNIRAKYGRLRGSVDFYERKVQRLGREVEGISRGDRWEEDGEEDDGEEEVMEEEIEVTDEDLRREEEEIRELERRKKELEERVSGMERDLGGLLR